MPELIEGADQIFEYPMVDRDPLPGWTQGRVTLMGDAAHPTFPVGSNGASQAIIDARVIGASLLTHGLTPAALEAFEAEVRPVTTAVGLANRGSGPDAILQRVGIAEKLYERTDQLSGGQQQRVAIARALFQEPLALLADEPVSSVDPARARDTVSLLTKLSEEDGLTLCMSLHNIELACEFFPRVIGLRHGRIQFDSDGSSLDGAGLKQLFDLTEEEQLDA